MRKKALLAFALTAVFALALSATASAVTVTTIPVTGSPLSIDVSGHLVTYASYVDHDDYTIHLVDLGLGTDTAITSANLLAREGPTIDGTRVVWYEGGGSGLFLYDTSAPVFGGAFIPGTGTPPTAYTFSPALSGNILAWIKFDFSGPMKSDIWYQQGLGTAGIQVTNLAMGRFVQPPDVSGGKIVWADNRNGASNFDVFYYDTALPHVPGGTPITSGGPIQVEPRISGNNVVYVDNADGDPEVYLYPLPSGPAQKITDNTMAEYLPDIGGTNIVWARQGQIFMYDMLTGQTSQLSDGNDEYSSPRIDGNHVVWLNVPPETLPPTPALAYMATIQEEVTPQPGVQLPYTGK